MSGVKPRKAGCENCRTRHVKCEGGLPCLRCTRRGLNCYKTPRTRFRHASASITGQAEFDFPAQQVWCNTSGKKIDFVDQTLETTRYYHDEYQSDHNFEPSLGSRPSEPRSIGAIDDVDSFTPGIEIDQTSGSSNRSLPAANAQPFARSFGEALPDTAAGCSHIGGNRAQGVVRPLPDVDHGSLSQHGEFCREDAARKTLQYFVESIGPSLDPCDQYVDLAVQISERALKYPQLLSLIALIGEAQDPNVNHISQMSQRVNDFAFEPVNNLVSAFLSRLIDNLQGLAINSTSSVHEKSIQYALNHQDLYPEEERRFVHQMLWASLRQEMFIAITNHDGKACVSWDMETLHQLQSSPGDEKWTNRVFLQLISALQYCSGDTKSSAVYDRLVDDLGQWMQSKPTWFTPILFQPPQNGQLFPGIWLLNEFAAVASQYYHLVRIILIAHNPRMPSLGPAKRVAAQRRDEQIKNDVKIICAIALSRASIDPMHLPACMAIALAGVYFTDPQEQASLLNILVETQHRHGWSTQAAQDSLKNSWEISTCS